MNYEPFFEQFAQATGFEEQCIRAFHNRVQTILVDEASPEDRNNINMLLTGLDEGVGADRIYHKKKYVVMFYEWLRENGAVSQETLDYVKGLTIKDVVIQTEITTSFFASLESIIAFIDLVGSGYGFGARTDQPRVKSIVILAWYGFTTAEMSSIRFSNMSDEHNSVSAGDKTAVMRPEHYKLLRDCADSSSYRGLLNGKIGEFKSSPYILRSPLSERATPATIRQTLKHFNNCASKYAQKLRAADITKSGFMYKVWERKSATGKSLREVMRELCPGTRRSDLYRKELLYDKWVSTFKQDN